RAHGRGDGELRFREWPAHRSTTAIGPIDQSLGLIRPASRWGGYPRTGPGGPAVWPGNLVQFAFMSFLTTGSVCSIGRPCEAWIRALAGRLHPALPRLM